MFLNHVLYDLSGESVIIFNKDVLSQGLCHLNGVSIDLNITCELQSLAQLDFYVEANEYARNSKHLFDLCDTYKQHLDVPCIRFNGRERQCIF